jgi:hypothetical protein
VIGFDSQVLKEEKEEKEMHSSKPLTPSIFLYVLGALKGCGKTLGEIAAQARQFENEMNAWMDVVERKEVKQ